MSWRERATIEIEEPQKTTTTPSSWKERAVVEENEVDLSPTQLEKIALTFGIGVDKLRKGIAKEGKEFLRRFPRNLMQAAIGTAAWKILMGPAGPPLLLAEPAIPGAQKGEILEEEFFRRELPPRIREALDLPEYKPEVAEEAQQALWNKITGGEGVIGGLASLPFRLAGIETTPQGSEHFPRLAAEFLDVIAYAPQLLNYFAKGVTQSPFAKWLRGKLGPEAREAFGFPGKEKITRRSPIEEEAIERIFERETGVAAKEAQEAQREAEESYKASLPPSRLRGRAEELAPSETPQIPFTPFQETPASMRPLNAEARDTFTQIGRRVSPTRFPNVTAGGRSEVKAVQEASNRLRRPINQAYEEARHAYTGIESPYPQLVSQLETFEERILAGRNLNELNPSERKLVDSVQTLRNTLVTEEGNFISRPVSALIQTAKSWNSLIKHENLYGNVLTLMSELIPEVTNAALRAVERSGGNPALLRRADNMFREWASRFATDEISPFLKRDILNPEQLFRSSISKENSFRGLERALENTPEGSRVLPLVQRHFVEEKMLPYIKDLNKVGSREYNQAIENLRPLIGEEATNAVDSEFRRLNISRPPRFEKLPTPQPIPSKKIISQASKVTKMSQPKLRGMLNETSTIKELKEMLSHNPGERELFEKLKADKIYDIATGGKVKGTLTGKSAFDQLNKRENFEIISEFYGPEKAKKMLETFEKIGEKEVTKQKLGKVGQHLIGIKILKRLLPYF